MSTEKQNKGKITSLTTSGVMVIIACAMIILYVAAIKENRQHTDTIIEMKTTAEVVKTELTSTTTKLSEYDLELTKLKNLMKGIHNQDDLLKRDIFLYIDKKFQLIPRVVSLTIAEEILIQSKAENISPVLILGIMRVESGFNPSAVSKMNARGLMQVMPEWAPKLGLKKVSDLHDIDTNIQCGIKVLKIHIEEEDGNISKGLYRYVGKSDTYSGKVYAAIGEFVAFRSAIDTEMNNGKGDLKKANDSKSK